MKLRIVFFLALFGLAIRNSGVRGDDLAAPETKISETPLDPTLERLAARVDRLRQEQGVPGVALVVVKGDDIVLNRGFGTRDVEKGLPVTPTTLFRIGSTTKAFTAMLAEMSVDDRVLKLDDSPKRYLPNFKLRDPIADKSATLRDFLSHRSGLKRTDLAWSTGALSRAEVIQAIGEAQPTAPLRSLFQYNNVGYSIVGEAIASAQGKRWENLVSERIFAPLGMNASLTSPAEMAVAPDFAYSYKLNPRTRSASVVPPVDTNNIAAATALVSNATDMAQWLRLMLNRGVYEGKTLVSRRGYDELLSPFTNIDANTQYALGWYLESWRGHRVVRHGGTIGSFRTEVALMPDQNLGFVLLANASSETLQSNIDRIVWSSLVPVPEGDDEPISPSNQGGRLPFGGGRPPSEGDDDPTPRRRFEGGFSETPFGFWADLVASYRSASGSVVEIAWRNGRAVFVVPSGKAYGLIPRGNDVFALAGLSEGFALRMERNDKGQVSGIALKQPVGNMSYERMPDFVAPFSADELMNRVVEAAGGEANLRRHPARTITFEATFENEGVTADGKLQTQRPASASTDLSLLASGKPIGTVHEYFRNDAGEVSTDWNGKTFPTDPNPFLNRPFDYANALDDQQLVEWKTMFKTIAIKRVSRVGDETAYVVEKTPVRGAPITDYISTTSFRLLKRESPVSGWVRGNETYSDYRTLEGVAIPFRIEVDSPRLGKVVLRVKDVQFKDELPETNFAPKP